MKIYKIFYTDSFGIEQSFITENLPPKWWPFFDQNCTVEEYDATFVSHKNYRSEWVESQLDPSNYEIVEGTK